MERLYNFRILLHEDFGVYTWSIIAVFTLLLAIRIAIALLMRIYFDEDTNSAAANIGFIGIFFALVIYIEILKVQCIFLIGGYMTRASFDMNTIIALIFISLFALAFVALLSVLVSKTVKTVISHIRQQR